MYRVEVKVVHANGTKDIALKLQKALSEGEQTGRTFIIVNFDIHFMSGTESIGHFAPVGAYDAKTKKVLIMDPDRIFLEPYWVSEHKLLKSMTTQDSVIHKNRGFLVITSK